MRESAPQAGGCEALDSTRTTSSHSPEVRKNSAYSCRSSAFNDSTDPSEVSRRALGSRTPRLWPHRSRGVWSSSDDCSSSTYERAPKTLTREREKSATLLPLNSTREGVTASTGFNWWTAALRLDRHRHEAPPLLRPVVQEESHRTQEQARSLASNQCSGLITAGDPIRG